MIDDHTFALCLTHDVDRPYLRWHQALYYALSERSAAPLRTLLAGENPYWGFDRVAALERDLGVRSAFYVLDDPNLLTERPPRDWLVPEHWVQHLGRYDPTRSEVAATLRDLDGEGWEVGLHGSLYTPTDPDRLRTEKERLESVLGHPVRGVRQHYLRLDGTRTWRHQADLGLAYDASLGSGTAVGFTHGYGLLRPFDTPFVVFPLTVMEQALPDPGASFDRAWAVCAELLEEAAANDAVMTVLWHPRYFSEEAFPGYAALYRRLIEAALDAGAWVGPPGDLLDRVDDPSVLVTDGAVPDASTGGPT